MKILKTFFLVDNIWALTLHNNISYRYASTSNGKNLNHVWRNCEFTIAAKSLRGRYRRYNATRYKEIWYLYWQTDCSYKELDIDLFCFVARQNNFFLSFWFTVSVGFMFCFRWKKTLDWRLYVEIFSYQLFSAWSVDIQFDVLFWCFYFRF